MRQRQEDLLARRLPRANHILDDRVAAGVSVLVLQAIEDPLGRVPLLLVNLLVGLQDLVNDRHEGIDLGPRLGNLRRYPGGSTIASIFSSVCQ